MHEHWGILILVSIRNSFQINITHIGLVVFNLFGFWCFKLQRPLIQIWLISQNLWNSYVITSSESALVVVRFLFIFVFIEVLQCPIWLTDHFAFDITAPIAILICIFTQFTSGQVDFIYFYERFAYIFGLSQLVVSFVYVGGSFNPWYNVICAFFCLNVL